jgi:hypothetical protein
MVSTKPTPDLQSFLEGLGPTLANVHVPTWRAQFTPQQRHYLCSKKFIRSLAKNLAHSCQAYQLRNVGFELTIET